MISWIPAFAGMSRTRSVQLSQELGEIAVARFARRGLEGPAEGGGDAGMIGRKVDTNDSTIHGAIRRFALFTFCVHQ